MDPVSIAAAWGLSKWGEQLLVLLNSPGGQLALQALFANRGINEQVLEETIAGVRNRKILPPKEPDVKRGVE